MAAVVFCFLCTLVSNYLFITLECQVCWPTQVCVGDSYSTSPIQERTSKLS